MKQISKILALCMAIFVGAAFTLPSQFAPAEIHAVSKVKINKTEATLAKGDTLQLKITGTKKKVKWSSSKKSVATVSSKGKVTAKKIGKTTITAKVGSKKYKCKVEVKKFPNYKKLIVGMWAGHTNKKDYLEWEFKSNGKFEYVYYLGIDDSENYEESYGTYQIKGNKLTIKDGWYNLKTTYTIKKLEKDKVLILKNKKNTYNLYWAHV